MIGFGLGKINSEDYKNLYKDIKQSRVLFLCLEYLLCCDDKDFEEHITFLKTLREAKRYFDENKGNEVNNNDKK